MSSIFDNDKNKKKCQKFTPEFMTEMMLDLAGYTENFQGKKVLENSFGSGNILKAIIKRYIVNCLEKKISPRKISETLENDIYGIELDAKLFFECKNELDAMVRDYKIPSVKWNLYNGNALTWDSDLKFDLIIGNPPYITYKEIDDDSKKQIKDKFSTCSVGKFDYCYAFIELGIQYLNKNGKLVQLIPSNIYKNVFAEELRKKLKEFVSDIFEFPSQKLFEKTLTSTSIFVYDRNYKNDYINYENVTKQIKLRISKDSLNDKWIFSKKIEKDNEMIRFGDVFNASVVIATLFNKAFIINKTQTGNLDLEYSILRRTVSPRSIRYNREEYIIFPYRYIDDKLTRYKEEEFIELFPVTVRHLEKFSDNLKKRKTDKNSLWFEYGRTQALAHLNQKKLLLSTVATNQIELHSLDEETIPYSGIYVVPKIESNFSLDDARKILESTEFLEYVQKVGISVSGNSVRITCRDICNYEFKGR